MACASLQLAGVPFRLQGDRAGVFGATFQGVLAQGLNLSVPGFEVERAREILGLEGGEPD